MKDRPVQELKPVRCWPIQVQVRAQEQSEEPMKSGALLIATFVKCQYLGRRFFDGSTGYINHRPIVIGKHSVGIIHLF